VNSHPKEFGNVIRRTPLVIHHVGVLRFLLSSQPISSLKKHKNNRGIFYDFSLSASPSSFPKEVWTTTLDQLSQRIKQYFVRPESHQRALAYLQGLME
jgi:hypothetical protein